MRRALFLVLVTPFLVDDSVGTGHKLYGMLPNKTYLIRRSGKGVPQA